MRPFPILLFFLSSFLAGCYGDAPAATPPTGPIVTLGPQDDIGAAAQSNPEGTTFNLVPGIYRSAIVQPKDYQKFVGAPGVVFNGAMILGDWKQEEGHWVATGLPAPQRRSGYCHEKNDLCTFREDLFVGGVYYKRVATAADLRKGSWYFEDGKALLADDPRGKRVELSVVPAAFYGTAIGVVLKDIVVEKYASEAQQGAIDGSASKNWELVNVVARWNHGAGLRIGDGMHLRGGSYSHNGQIGILGKGEGVVVDSVEIAANNYAEFDGGWEAGGTKFVDTVGLMVRKSCVHDNLGPGLWTDINNEDTHYVDNIVFENYGDGIKHEISYKATIRGNIVGENGKAWDNWLWGSQILIQNSSDVEVTQNTVQVSAKAGNGISMVYQDRGMGKYGPWKTTKNWVHQNKVVYLGAHGAGGLVADYETEKVVKDDTNRFERNEYFVKDPNFPYWVHKDKHANWAQLKELGGEPNSRLDTGKPPAIKLACKR